MTKNENENENEDIYTKTRYTLEQPKCCFLESETDKVACVRPAGFQIWGKRGCDDYTYACADHVEALRREGDEVWPVAAPPPWAARPSIEWNDDAQVVTIAGQAFSYAFFMDQSELADECAILQLGRGSNNEVTWRRRHDLEAEAALGGAQFKALASWDGTFHAMRHVMQKLSPGRWSDVRDLLIAIRDISTSIPSPTALHTVGHQLALEWSHGVRQVKLTVGFPSPVDGPRRTLPFLRVSVVDDGDYANQRQRSTYGRSVLDFIDTGKYVGGALQFDPQQEESPF